jgi:hypothetical protein
VLVSIKKWVTIHFMIGKAMYVNSIIK